MSLTVRAPHARGVVLNDVREILKLTQTGSPTGSGVRVGVVDSGVDYTHPDLVDAVDRSRSAIIAPEIKSDLDVHYHGTHVAGVIAGRGVQSHGAQCGVAPGATIISLKVCDKHHLLEQDVIAALFVAMEQEVDIVCLALYLAPHPRRGPKPPWVWGAGSALDATIRRASEQGILCVAAAGNIGHRGTGTVARPGESPHALTVGALTRKNEVYPWQSRGPQYRLNIATERVRTWQGAYDSAVSNPKPDIVVPGFDMWAPWSRHAIDLAPTDLRHPKCRGNWYIDERGTSQAAAVAAGLAACATQYARATGKWNALSHPRGLTLKSIIMAACTPIDGASVDASGSGTLDWPSLKGCIDAL